MPNPGMQQSPRAERTGHCLHSICITPRPSSISTLVYTVAFREKSVIQLPSFVQHSPHLWISLAALQWAAQPHPGCTGCPWCSWREHCWQDPCSPRGWSAGTGQCARWGRNSIKHVDVFPPPHPLPLPLPCIVLTRPLHHHVGHQGTATENPDPSAGYSVCCGGQNTDDTVP